MGRRVRGGGGGGNITVLTLAKIIQSFLSDRNNAYLSKAI